MAAFPTSTTVLDSILFRDAFGTPQMREVFSDFSLISRYAEVEVALAQAEARCGVIPVEAAAEIARLTDVSKLDFDLLRRETDVVGYPILPLVHQMVEQCGEAVARDMPGGNGNAEAQFLAQRLLHLESLVAERSQRAGGTGELADQ
jgi:hypothetical protein